MLSISPISTQAQGVSPSFQAHRTVKEQASKENKSHKLLFAATGTALVAAGIYLVKRGKIHLPEFHGKECPAGNGDFHGKPKSGQTPQVVNGMFETDSTRLNQKPYTSDNERNLVNHLKNTLEHNTNYNSSVDEARSIIAQELKSCWTLYGQGFQPVDKVVRFADGTSVRIVFEGLDVDITEDGRLLRKVLITVGGDKVKYGDVTEDLFEQVSKQKIKQHQIEQARRESENTSTYGQIPVYA